MNKDIVFLGIQGCGKGTQAKASLARSQNHLYIEMGDILRDLIATKNIIGNYVADKVNNGILVDSFLPIDIFEICLKIAGKQGKLLLIDGFPRRMDEAVVFHQKMEMYYREYIVVQLELSREKALERMATRAKLENRKDDTPESMEKRIATFEKETVPVLEYFQNLEKLIVINADDTIENIQAEIIKQTGL